jgi:hypothetical protein
MFSPWLWLLVWWREGNAEDPRPLSTALQLSSSNLWEVMAEKQGQHQGRMGRLPIEKANSQFVKIATPCHGLQINYQKSQWSWKSG